MQKLSEADTKYVNLLILDCEDFYLNEKEPLAYCPYTHRYIPVYKGPRTIV